MSPQIPTDTQHNAVPIAEPQAKRPKNLLWLQTGGCGGCTMSLLSAEHRDLFAALARNGLHLLWHPAVSEASGASVRQLLHDCEQGHVPIDVLCIEGAVPRGPQGTGRFHILAGTGRSMLDWVRALAPKAEFLVAVGSCAAYGGMTTAGDNPSDAAGLQYEGDSLGGILPPSFRSRSGLPVINVAGCAPHPNWILETLSQIGDDSLSSDGLDAWARPRTMAETLVHHGCPRNEFYEFKASAEKPGDLGCLMEHLGCKGTQVHADCNTRLWHGVGSCTRAGYACIACTEPGFESPGHAYALTPKVAGIPVGLPTDMPKAWFVALASLSKSATPKRLKQNAVSDHLVAIPMIRRRKK